MCPNNLLDDPQILQIVTPAQLEIPRRLHSLRGFSYPLTIASTPKKIFACLRHARSGTSCPSLNLTLTTFVQGNSSQARQTLALRANPLHNPTSLGLATQTSLGHTSSLAPLRGLHSQTMHQVHIGGPYTYPQNFCVVGCT